MQSQKKMKIMEGEIAKKSNSKNDLKLHKYQLKEWEQNLTNKKNHNMMKLKQNSNFINYLY